MLNITRQQAFLLSLLLLLFVFAVLIGFMLLVYQGTADTAVIQFVAVRWSWLWQL